MKLEKKHSIWGVFLCLKWLINPCVEQKITCCDAVTTELAHA